MNVWGQTSLGEKTETDFPNGKLSVAGIISEIILTFLMAKTQTFLCIWVAMPFKSHCSWKINRVSILIALFIYFREPIQCISMNNYMRNLRREETGMGKKEECLFIVYPLSVIKHVYPFTIAFWILNTTT